MAAALSAHSSPYGIRQNADINVTPFVDVMLVLLIIFMVAIPVATVSVDVDLPQASASSANATPVIVSLTKSGSLYVGDRATTLAGLPDAVQAAFGGADAGQARVHLRADEEVAYRDLMGVMNRLRDRGFEKVGLVAEEF
ncbi:MAG: ExbD/TolR family protein [Pseudomonadota bacterium]